MTIGFFTALIKRGKAQFSKDDKGKHQIVRQEGRRQPPDYFKKVNFDFRRPI